MGTLRFARSALLAVVLAVPAAGGLALGAPHAAGAVTNDNYANRITLPSTPTTATGSNVGATKEANEANHAGNVGGASVWWEWTPPYAGTWTIRTRGSDFDTLLAVYHVAPDLMSFTTDGSNDDESAATGVRTSTVTVTLATEIRYYIAVDGFNATGAPATGTVVLSVGSPANDDFANRVPLTINPNTNSGFANDDNSATELEPNESAIAPAPLGRSSLWYSLTPTSSGNLAIDLQNTTYSTGALKYSIGAYTGSSITALTQVAEAHSPTLNIVAPKLVFPATAGTTYAIRISGTDAHRGPIAFSVALDSPANDNYKAATALTGNSGVALGTTSGATFESNFEGESNSIFYKWTAPGNASLTISTTGSSVDTEVALYDDEGSFGTRRQLALDLDNGDGNSALLSYTVVAHVTYHIGIYDQALLAGATELNWQFGDRPDGGSEVTLHDASIAEGDAGTTAGSLTATLSGPSTLPVTFVWSTADGTGVGDTDYLADAGSITFPPGAVTKTIPLSIIGNTAPQENRTFLVEGSSLNAAASWDDDEAEVTIVDDESVPHVGLGSPDRSIVKESNTGTTAVTFPVTLTKPSTRTVQVRFFTLDGSAKAPNDYVTRTGYAIFSAGETLKHVTILVKGDTLDEPNETLRVWIAGAVNGALDNESQTITIKDDDPPPSVSIADAAVREPVSGSVVAHFTITLSAPSGKPIQVRAATTPGSATSPADFTAVDRVVKFATGVTTATLNVVVAGDGTAEGQQQFGVALSAPKNVTLLRSSATGTIDDPVPTVSIADASIIEVDTGKHPLAFTVTLDTSSIATTTVAFATSNGTAVAPGDYITTTGTVTFAPGAVSRSIVVQVKGDKVVETDETFTVVLSNPSGAQLGRATATGTIVDND